MSTAELRAVARRDGIKYCDELDKELLLGELYQLDNVLYGYYCTMIQLRVDARLRGLTGYSEMCKADLVQLIFNDIYHPNRRSYVPQYNDGDSIGSLVASDDDDDDDNSIGSLFASDDDDE